MDKCSGNDLLQWPVSFFVEAVDAPVVGTIRGVLTSGVVVFNVSGYIDMISSKKVKDFGVCVCVCVLQCDALTVVDHIVG